jgi:DNA primase
MVEDFGGQDAMEAYEDSVKVLRRSFLQQQLIQHSHKADVMLRSGDEGYQQELAESQRIKNEMDEL